MTEVAILRQKICDRIDSKTQEIMGRGFVFDEKTFSLSIEAQKNLLWWYTLFIVGRLIGPIQITTMKNRIYVLEEPKKPGFFETANGTVTEVLSAGRDLKEAVMKTTDLFILQNYQDPRV